MIYLNPDRSLELETSSTSTTHVVVFWESTRNHGPDATGRGGAGSTITTATTTTIAPAPDERTDRVITYISVSNRGVASQTISLKLDTSGSDVYLTSAITLDAGDTFCMTDNGYEVITSSGAMKGLEGTAVQTSDARMAEISAIYLTAVWNMYQGNYTPGAL